MFLKGKNKICCAMFKSLKTNKALIIILMYFWNKIENSSILNFLKFNS